MGKMARIGGAELPCDGWSFILPTDYERLASIPLKRIGQRDFE